MSYQAVAARGGIMYLVANCSMWCKLWRSCQVVAACGGVLHFMADCCRLWHLVQDLEAVPCCDRSWGGIMHFCCRSWQIVAYCVRFGGRVILWQLVDG